MGKEKWSYTQKWSEAGKEFPILCERIKCNRSKSNFATFKCQKGPSIDFDPPRVLVLLLFALWDFYVSCESEVPVILTIAYIFMISDPKPLSYVLSSEISIEKVFFSIFTVKSSNIFLNRVNIFPIVWRFFDNKRPLQIDSNWYECSLNCKLLGKYFWIDQ